MYAIDLRAGDTIRTRWHAGSGRAVHGDILAAPLIGRRCEVRVDLSLDMGGCVAGVLLAECSGMSSWEGADRGREGECVESWTFAGRAGEGKTPRGTKRLQSANECDDAATPLSVIPLPLGFRVAPDVARGQGVAYSVRQSVRTSIFKALGPNSFCRVVPVPPHRQLKRRALWVEMMSARRLLHTRVRAMKGLKTYGCQKSASLGVQLGHSCCVGPHATGFTSSTQAGAHALRMIPEVKRFCVALDEYLECSLGRRWEKIKAAVLKWVPKERCLFGMPFDALWANLDNGLFDKHEDPNEAGATMTVSWGMTWIAVGDGGRCTRADGDVAFGSYGWHAHGPGGRHRYDYKGGDNFTLTFYLSFYAAAIPVVRAGALLEAHVVPPKRLAVHREICDEMRAQLLACKAALAESRVEAAARKQGEKIEAHAARIEAQLETAELHFTHGGFSANGERLFGGNGVLYATKTMVNVATKMASDERFYYTLEPAGKASLNAYLRDGRLDIDGGAVRLVKHTWSRAMTHPVTSFVGVQALPSLSYERRKIEIS